MGPTDGLAATETVGDGQVMWLRDLSPACCACVAILSCAPADETRELELQDALVSDHLDLLRRDPAQVAAKWEAMEADPFQFLRGSAGLWARDASLPGGRANLPTILDAPVFARVLLVGDPHPENFGTFLPLDGALTFDLTISTPPVRAPRTSMCAASRSASRSPWRPSTRSSRGTPRRRWPGDGTPGSTVRSA